MSGRTKVWRADKPEEIWLKGKQIGHAPFWLGVDDDGGNGISHDHGDFGHEWPMTLDELRALASNILLVMATYERDGS